MRERSCFVFFGKRDPKGSFLAIGNDIATTDDDVCGCATTFMVDTNVDSPLSNLESRGTTLILLSRGAATSSDRQLKCIQILQLRTLTIPFSFLLFFLGWSRVTTRVPPVKSGDREKREKKRTITSDCKRPPGFFKVGNHAMYVHTRRAV